MTKQELKLLVAKMDEVGVPDSAAMTFHAIGPIPADAVVPMAFTMDIVMENATYTWNGTQLVPTVTEASEVVFDQG